MRITILASLREKLNQRVDKIIRKGGVVKCEYSEPYTSGDHYRVVDVDVDGSFVIPGWSFVASLDFDDKANSNIVRCTPNKFLPEIYNSRCECDHCKINRARKHTFVLQNMETGEYVQVGRGCVKDYTGYDATNYAGYLESLTNLQDWADNEMSRCFAMGREQKWYNTYYTIAQTVARVRERGYITRAMEEDSRMNGGNLRATVEDIKDLLLGTRDRKGNRLVESYPVTDSIKETVDEIYNLVKNAEGNNDFTHNCKVLLESESFEWKNIGFVVATYSFYDRKIKEQQKAKSSNSSYIGNVGDRIEFTSAAECVYTYDTQYGTTYLYRFSDGGNVIIWKTSTWLDDHKVYSIKATVKAQDEYRGIKQTEITRGKILACNKLQDKHLEDTEPESYQDHISKAMDMLYQ